MKEKSWQEIPIGGLIDEAGTSMQYKTGSWRSFKPIWHEDRCIQCLFCWNFCPEPSIFIEDGKEAARRWGFSIEQPPKPDKFLKNEDIITVGHHQLQVLHTPGHSPGGVIFLHDRIVFGGDNLFLGSIGRTDFRQGSFEDLSKSIKTQLYTLPDDTIVYTGHGPHTTIGHEKQYNPFVRP